MRNSAGTGKTACGNPQTSTVQDGFLVQPEFYDLLVQRSPANTQAGGDIIMEAGGAITTSQGGQLTNNGKNIGHDHKHTDVEPGAGQSGVPV
jgi:hypothetical protein